MAEETSNWATCMVKLETLHEDICEIKAMIKEQNGQLRRNTADLAVLKDWRASQMTPMITEVKTEFKDHRDREVEVRVELAGMKAILAKYGTMGASAGGVVGLLYIAMEIVKMLLEGTL